MAAGFNFLADGHFRFFFSYGAVDRTAEGTFTIEGNTVKLKSKKEAGKDFTVTKQSKEAKGYTLTFIDKNKYLLSNILCVFFVNGKEQSVITDDKGIAYLDLPHCDSIYAQHLLFPDVYTMIKDKDNQNNQFSLSLNPTLSQVSFKGIDLKIESNGSLSWLPNYFLDLPNVKFTKE